jgi:hypothetical protein
MWPFVSKAVRNRGLDRDRALPLADLINLSTNQIATRTTLVSIATALTVLPLFLMSPRRHCFTFDRPEVRLARKKCDGQETIGDLNSKGLRSERASCWNFLRPGTVKGLVGAKRSNDFDEKHVRDKPIPIDRDQGWLIHMLCRGLQT